MAELANLKQLGKIFEESAALLQDVIAILETKLGKGHPESVTHLMDLAYTHQELGQWNKVNDICEYVLETQKHRSKDNPYLAGARVMGLSCKIIGGSKSPEVSPTRCLPLGSSGYYIYW